MRKIPAPSVLLLVVLAALAASCNSWRAWEDRVVVTANRSVIEKCERIGPVSIGYTPSSREEVERQLRHEVVARGGNTLLVTSYALASDGTAFTCHPALDPNDRRVAPPVPGTNPESGVPR